MTEMLLFAIFVALACICICLVGIGAAVIRIERDGIKVNGTVTGGSITVKAVAEKESAW